MRHNRFRASGPGAVIGLALLVPAVSSAQEGGTITTPVVPRELPVEIETELAPAGSLKQAPLWKELAQLLEDPYGAPERRRSFLPPGCSYQADAAVPCDDALMPALGVYPLDYNVPTGQTLRLRTNDGEISWDQPGVLFDPDEVITVDANNTPLELRTVIGELVVDEDDNLVVSNPDGDDRLPPDGTIVAVPAVVDGVLHELDPETGELEEVDELEAPITELDFFRADDDTTGLPAAILSFAPRGRAAAEVLGKALFWDMQVGSDGVQACGTCHFAAGVDPRTRNQLNPDHLGGDEALDVVDAPDSEVFPEDFPFHKLSDPDLPGEPLMNDDNVVEDANDVMSSMGVAFQRFVDIPTPGPSAFAAAIDGVRPLLPDIGAPETDEIDAFVEPGTGLNLRRVEARNTPTMHSAAFNFDNFWDGRARFHFNGGSVFGPSDPQFHVWIDPGARGGPLEGVSNGHLRPELFLEDPEVAEQPVRIKFASLASQAVAPPLSDFEMSFAGRSWAKIGKKLLQGALGGPTVTPLARQLVSPTDSLLGPFSNQGGAVCDALDRPTAVGKPGLCVDYDELIRGAFPKEYWYNAGVHFDVVDDPEDPFDGVRLEPAAGPADPANTNEVNHMEANFAFFFGLSIQAYEQLLIPDDTPFDRFMDANPLAANGVGQPGEQGTLPPELVLDLVGGPLTLVDGFGEEELLGFDIFSGANLTAALPVGSARNPMGVGSNPFLRTARCMLCHLGPEQTDHTFNVNHGLVLSDTEFELPPPGAPEPTGPFRTVSGLMLAEEVEEVAQDGVEVENRDMVLVDDPATPYDDRQIAVPTGIAFQDNGIYNVGLRPTSDDLGRGADDDFGWPLALAELALMNLGGPDFAACDRVGDDPCALPNFDPALGVGGGLFEETGEDTVFPGTTHTLQSINPGLAMEPANPLLPPWFAPWVNNLPAGELHPLVDELAFAPNTITRDTPFAEFGEILFGSDLHCGTFDPDAFGAGAPNFGWGPVCPNSQSAIPNNLPETLNGTHPFENRVGRLGAFKAPQLRNVELTGPYFHTGSYLTLRQVVDFYLRGGDFPVTNAEDRDPNMVDVSEQAFGFGTTIGLPPEFQDGLPDLISQYGALPDQTALTPEYLTPEEATEAVVHFLLALTDDRVRFEQAPFDRPEIFVPIEGDSGRVGPVGRRRLAADPAFLHVEAVGAEGRVDALEAFLGVSRAPVDGDGNDHFDRR